MKHRRLGLLALLVVVSSTFAVPALGHGGDGARTLTLVSGNAAAPGRDPFTKFSLDGGSTWKEAFVVPKCGSPGPWDAAACLAWANPIPGTEWIAVNADKSGPPHVAEYSAMLMHSTEGRCYSIAEMQEYLRDAGFGFVKFTPTAAARGIIVAAKPA
jgi:hypothetical protein